MLYLPGGGAMLFLADAVHENDEIIKWTRRYLLGHRRILKKGRLYHTLRKSIFSKGKRRPEMQYFQAAVIFAKPDGFCSGVIRYSQLFQQCSFLQ
jgi:hypothetical protein